MAHLIIEGEKCDPEYLDNPRHIHNILDRLPPLIQMHKISEPLVLPYTSRKPEECGWTGLILIAESHISIHTFPLEAYVNMDIFTCKPFINSEQTLRIAQRVFQIGEMRYRLMNRGIEYPFHISQAILVATGERQNLIQERVGVNQFQRFPATGG